MSESVNRAFMYGESVFTTTKSLNGHLCDWNLHFERLKSGVGFVFGPFEEDQWDSLLKNQVEANFAGLSGDQIVRVTIYRHGSRGLIHPAPFSVRDLKIDVSTSGFEASAFERKMLNLRTCKSHSKPEWWPSFLKSGDYLSTILTQKKVMQEGDDDILFLGPGDTVLESSVANIFLVRHNRIFTSPAGPNVLAGVMRQKVIDHALDFFEECEEIEFSLSDLLKADGVFGTNSVRGPFLIKTIDDQEIQHSKEFLRQFEIMRKKILI